MKKSSVWIIIGAFILGLALGGFGALVIIREAVPLRDHFSMLVLYILLSIPICFVLLIWYFNLGRKCCKVFGEKTGKLVTLLLSFLLVSIVIIFILIVGLFFSAVA